MLQEFYEKLNAKVGGAYLFIFEVVLANRTDCLVPITLAIRAISQL
jgi:hypothetical protein